MLLLERRGARVTYSDPFVGSLRLDHGDREMKSSDVLANCAAADCVVVVTDHADFDYPGILEKSKLIVDTRNAYHNLASPKIVRL